MLRVVPSKSGYLDLQANAEGRRPHHRKYRTRRGSREHDRSGVRGVGGELSHQGIRTLKLVGGELSHQGIRTLKLPITSRILSAVLRRQNSRGMNKTSAGALRIECVERSRMVLYGD